MDSNAIIYFVLVTYKILYMKLNDIVNNKDHKKYIKNSVNNDNYNCNFILIF